MIQLILKYLQKSNYSSRLKNFEDAFLSHPNYPSLLAVTDSLLQLNIEHIAANVPFVHIEKLPDCFITVINLEIESYYLINKVEANFEIESNTGIKSTLTSQELENSWTGTVLIIEENQSNAVKSNFNRSNYLLPFMLLLLLLFALISIYTDNLNLLNTVFLFLCGIGFYISIEILKTYFDDNQNSESKFCTISKDFSCTSIIKSKNYKFSKYIEFVDLPLVFFSSAFFTQILGLNTMFLVGLFSLMSLPFLIYSIYLQKFVLKKWCLLCLIVSFLILCIGILFVLTYKNKLIDIHILSSFLIVLVAFAVGWYFIKNEILQSKRNLKKLNHLLRYKRNENVFAKTAETVLNKEQFETLDKIVLGNQNAPNTLTLFLSPSCPHCHIAFKNATDLIAKYREQLKLEICFNVNINNLENPFIIVYKSILQLYNNQNTDFLMALEDWHIKNHTLEVWLKKWFTESNFTKESNQIEAHYQWCVNSDLNYAPIKIFNKKMLPEVYEQDELFYFFEE